MLEDLNRLSEGWHVIRSLSNGPWRGFPSKDLDLTVYNTLLVHLESIGCIMNLLFDQVLHLVQICHHRIFDLHLFATQNSELLLEHFNALGVYFKDTS